jgi:hypothetical protein
MEATIQVAVASATNREQIMGFKRTTGQVYSPEKFISTAILVILAGCMVVLLGGCSSGYSPPSYENVSAVIAQQPCVATVCVGDAGRQKTVEKLSRHEFVFDVTEDSGPVWFRIEGGGSGMITFRPDRLGSFQVVDDIGLSVIGMPLGNVLGTLGEPDELFVMFGCGHGSYIHGRLFYRDKGIEVALQFPAEMNERATPVALTDSASLVSIGYFEPAKYDERLLNIYEAIRRNGHFDVPRDVTPEILAAAVQPWPGTGVPIEALDLCPR